MKSDVLLGGRINEHWNVASGRELSGPWTSFTQFTLLNEKRPDGYTWSGGRLTKIQATSKTDYLWPEILVKYFEKSSTKSKSQLGD